MVSLRLVGHCAGRPRPPCAGRYCGRPLGVVFFVTAPGGGVAVSFRFTPACIALRMVVRDMRVAISPLRIRIIRGRNGLLEPVSVLASNKPGSSRAT